ncbi:MAG: hypothetical protein AABM67_08325 [Acidobacteriota bacterium]
MNEEPTKDLPGKKSFEERVFARFDAFDGRFDAVDARFDGVDARFDTVDARLKKLEARAYDTKPIWEKALAQIMETGLEIGEIKKNVSVIDTKVGVIDNRVAVLETETARIRFDYGGIRSEFADLKQELVRQLTRRLDLVLRTLVDQRDELRAAEDRITQLESKLA